MMRRKANTRHPAAQVPTLFVTTAALAQIGKEVAAFPHRETAWVNYGMLEPGAPVPTITLLGILTTQETEHGLTHTAIGGEDLAPKMAWLNNAFAVLQREGKYPPDAAFLFLFKGHSHPHGLSLAQSGSDRHATLAAVIADGVAHALAPIAGLVPAGWRLAPAGFDREAFSTAEVRVRGDRTRRLMIRFYYYSRDLYAHGVRAPLVIAPLVTDAVAEPLPLLWMYQREDYFATQMHQLAAQGYHVHPWKQDYPEGLRLYVSRPEWEQIVAIHTPWDYPRHPATMQVRPKGHRQEAAPAAPKRCSGTLVQALRNLQQEGSVKRGTLSSGRRG
jgi:hypothetical protein